MRSARIRSRSAAVSSLVDLVLGELGVDLAHDDAVVLARALDARRSRRRRPPAPPSGSRSSGSPKPPPPADGRVKRSPGPTGTFEKTAPRKRSPSLPVSQTPCGIDGQAAVDAPRDRAGAVAHVRHDGRPRPRAGSPPFSTPQPPRNLPGPARVGEDLVAGRQDRAEPLLAFERLHGEADAEDRRRRVRAVLAVPAAPAADHPVVPHEDRPLVVPRVAAADEQVLEVEASRRSPARACSSDQSSKIEFMIFS